jgi:PHD/YefM family antitoxin component YafN of YafNO toxin-antitoxin module
MAILLDNIHSLSDFQRNTKKYVERMKKTGEPTVLTVNGQAELVMQSAKAYQSLLDSQDLLESIIAIREGLEQVGRGEGMDADEFFGQLEKELGISSK